MNHETTKGHFFFIPSFILFNDIIIGTLVVQLTFCHPLQPLILSSRLRNKQRNLFIYLFGICIVIFHPPTNNSITKVRSSEIYLFVELNYSRIKEMQKKNSNSNRWRETGDVCIYKARSAGRGALSMSCVRLDSTIIEWSKKKILWFFDCSR